MQTFSRAAQHLPMVHRAAMKPETLRLLLSAHAHPLHSLLTYPPMKKDQLLLPLRLSLLAVRDVDVSLFQLQVSKIHPSLTHMLSAILNE